MSDPFEEEAESIIASAEEAGHVIRSKERRASLLGELTEILDRAWGECMDRVREVAHEKEN